MHVYQEVCALELYFHFFLSPVGGGLGFRSGYGGYKNTTTGWGAKKFLDWGKGDQKLISCHKNFGNGGFSYPVIFSRICYLLLAKNINALFFIRSSTLSLNVIVLKFSSFFSLR